MYLLAFLCVCFYPNTKILFGQNFEQHTKNDTTRLQQLQTVEIIGAEWEKYTLGTKRQTADSAYIAQNPTQNMGDWLLYNSPAYIKQYGNGMLGAISMRGTGASHTSVLWNGIPINSLTLGESDFGNIPLNNTQKITLHYGGASVWQGSEAIGGAVEISQNPLWNNQKNITFRQNFGSFGQRFSQIQGNFSNKKWEFQNTISTQFVQNNFDFYNKTQQNAPLETQQNAQWQQHSITQDIYYKPNQNTLFGLKIWGQTRFLHIQPTMSANQDQSTWTTQKDDNIRILFDVQKHFNTYSLFVKQAYLYDYLLFNEQQKTATSRFVTQVKAEINWGSNKNKEKNNRNITLQFGINNTLIRTDVEAYKNQIWENRIDIFAYLLYEFSKKYQISFNIRQNIVNQNFVPITPNVSQQYFFIQKENTFLYLKNSFSRNYKVPTLNDRYWAGSANPNLRPENAWSGELGLFFGKNFTADNSIIRLSADITHYQMYVQDWIIWIPQGSIWQPQNRRNVEIKGLETQIKLQKTSKIKHKNTLDFVVSFQYAFTQSLNRETAESTEYYLDNKQLPYTPQHRWSGFATLAYRNFFTNITYQYTGQRFETLDNADTFLGRLSAFQTVNLSVGKNISYQKYQFSVNFQAKNLLNEDYQNYLFRAMPLRNYAIGITGVF